MIMLKNYASFLMMYVVFSTNIAGVKPWQEYMKIKTVTSPVSNGVVFV